MAKIRATSLQTKRHQPKRQLCLTAMVAEGRQHRNQAVKVLLIRDFRIYSTDGRKDAGPSRGLAAR
ncbi:hypothetical protein [Furfurilactobacillus rossiae]|uniref:hypothetical protein n=1 Tax=Furfurilactobacillus rossiae TaxID=231049 RepID=UPI0012DD9639|nr:hypothetical protein [Furfurilactobacillus rossiae]